MSVWLIGSSHMGALRQWQASQGRQPGDFLIKVLGPSRLSRAPFHRVVKGELEFTNDYQDNAGAFLHDLASGDVSGVGVGLGDTNNIILNNPDYWSRHEPAAIAAKGRVPLPETTLAAIVESQAAPVVQFMTDLAALVPQCFWLVYPAIKSQHPMFQRGVRREVARYVDSAFLGHMTSRMRSLGLDVIERPSESLTPDGFLKAEFSSQKSASGQPDSVHANAAYGRLVLETVREQTGSLT